MRISYWSSDVCSSDLDPALYYPDGQIKGEVFEYGSFLQSRMYRAGVTCSNCHNPHSGTLRAEGNGVCTQCHQASRYDTPDHFNHPADRKSVVQGQSGLVRVARCGRRFKKKKKT